MTVTHSGSVYETTAYDGTKGIFNAEEDSFACENLDVYSNPPYYALLLASERDPSAPFVSVSHIGDVADHAQCDRLVACHALSVHGHRFLRTGPLRKGGGAEGERHCQDQKDAECFFHRLFCPFLV